MDKAKQEAVRILAEAYWRGFSDALDEFEELYQQFDSPTTVIASLRTAAQERRERGVQR